jgi:molybdopterin converting factor small subunit
MIETCGELFHRRAPDGRNGRLPVNAAARYTCPAYTWPATPGELQMAIEVRIPTILRTFTGGAKSVEGSGDTLDALIADLDARHAGLRDRLVDDAGLRRFVNVYLNDEDVRFLGGLSAPVKDGDTVTVLPAVAGGMR